MIDNKKIRISDEGYFVFGLNKDRKNDVKIKKLIFFLPKETSIKVLQ